ncbi:Protein disulfide isomerase (prolyl 4-hydroxylase beta subunit) [Handroanthus impetiginosus]|uniref:Protein disulfide-isomerase n=1 Tax=Handroanthus impetiginosus TaxID=429701 RepID=A0A2G9HC51_9LAMI|nr:Protein disulfide isomerase (prolyl 4-hydroxylase beta subunit) [Handroanthus impetiginosus]
MATRRILLLTLASLLLFSLISAPIFSSAAATDEDEDLSFLEELESGDAVSGDHHHSDVEYSDNEEEDFENYDDFDVPSDFTHQEEEDEVAKFDEKDVVVLTDGNFSDFVDENKYVMVEFYAPWCGHCKALAPEYAAAATALKEDNVTLAKVDATEENELAEKYEVQGFPTVYFFVDGEHKPYSGQRTKDGIVIWIKKKIGPGISNITTTEDAEHILTSEDKVVLAFLNSLVGPDSQEFSAASKLDDDVNFYQTSNPSVAKMFHLEADVKRPALVLLKKEAEKVTHFDGQFKKSVIAEFVSANKLPLVTTFSRESAPLIFESSIRKQLLLFATSNDSQAAITTFQEAAKLFKGKLIFVYVDVDNEEVGKPVADYFGVTGDAPKVLGYAANDESRKYILDGEVTLENIKAFGEAFLEDKLKPFYKSDPIPETNDGDVKIVVGNNFDDIVLDKSKDVLLEIYAPWCGHCQSLEPTYNKLAKHLRVIESLVIAKMDGTTNEHPRAKADGFPTILFFPAGKKSADPIPCDADRTVVAFYKFLKEHASIPFKLQKPASSAPVSEDSQAKEGIKTSSTSDVKDEL